MNKYEKKVLEVASKDALIYELTKEKLKGKIGNIFDFITFGLVSFGDGVKQLGSIQGAYYLLIEGKQADLVHIHHNLDVEYDNVTHQVQGASNRRTFDVDGYRYKLYRKIR